METETDTDAGELWVHIDAHLDRVSEARRERDHWRRLALWAFAVAGVAILLMLIVAGNALDSQSVVAR